MIARIEMGRQDGVRYFRLNGTPLELVGLDVVLKPRHVRALGVEPVRGDSYLLIGGNRLAHVHGEWTITVKKLPLPEFAACGKSFTYRGEIAV